MQTNQIQTTLFQRIDGAERDSERKVIEFVIGEEVGKLYLLYVTTTALQNLRASSEMRGVHDETSSTRMAANSYRSS
jgi:hypothetical protein